MIPIVRKRLRFSYLLVWFHLCLAGLADAWGGTPAFVERVWLLDEGLPHNVVHRTVQDKRGFLWITNAHGLTRFDGRDFKDYSPVFPGDFRQSVRDIDLASDGSLLLLPAAGGVVSMKDGVSSRHPLSDAVAHEQLFNIYVEPSGAVWVAGSSLYRWHGGRVEEFGPDQGFHRKYGARYHFATDERGQVWIAMGADLYRYEQGRFFTHPAEGGGNVCLGSVRGGGVWILNERGLSRASNQTIERIASSADWPRIGEAASVMEDRNGALWIASRNHGLFRFAEGILHPVPVSHQRLSSMMEDDEGNIWVSSNGGGLMRIRPRAYVSLPTGAGAPPEATSSICEATDGTLWLANREDSLASWKNDQMRVVAPLSSSRNMFYLLCADQAGRIWASGSDGLYRFPADHPERIEKMPGISGAIYALHCAHNGDVWVSSEQDRAAYFRDDIYHPVSPNDGPLVGRLSAFAEDGSGRLWMATQEGALYEFRNGQLVRDGFYDKPFGHRIHALHADRDGSLWIGTRVGLVRKRGDEYRFINAASGLPDDLIIQILEDDTRRLWIGSRGGIYGVSLDELNAVAEGRRTRLGALTLGRNEGLVGAYSYVSGPPTALRGRNGILWFTTHRGVVGIDPSVQMPGPKEPRVYVDEAFVHGVSHRVIDGHPLLIPAGTSSVEFRFAAINFSAPEKVRIRHRLSGLESDWTETTTQRSATYAQLPPGTYELLVSVGDQSGSWSEKLRTLSVIVAPAWWQTWWLRSAALIAFTAATIFVARHWSHRRLQARLIGLEQAHALEEERARIARDLHDELGGSLTQIGLLAARVKRQASHAEIEQPLNDLAWRARSIAAELESIVWTVSPKNTTWSALTTFLGSFAARFFRDAEISCAVETTGAMPDRHLPPEVQHHVLAIAKEAMNNVCKHARASSVVLTLGTDGGSFFLQMKDDGRGFDPGSPEHSERNGLSNMQARAREIGASLHIASRRGGGTELTLRVPLDTIATKPRLSRS